MTLTTKQVQNFLDTNQVICAGPFLYSFVPQVPGGGRRGEGGRRGGRGRRGGKKKRRRSRRKGRRSRRKGRRRRRRRRRRRSKRRRRSRGSGEKVAVLEIERLLTPTAQACTDSLIFTRPSRLYSLAKFTLQAYCANVRLIHFAFS